MHILFDKVANTCPLLKSILNKNGTESINPTLFQKDRTRPETEINHSALIKMSASGVFFIVRF